MGGLKNIVDNYEPVWHCFDAEQPLLMPTMFGHGHNIERLLAKGAEIDKYGEEDRWTWALGVEWVAPPNPLILAAYYGILDSAKTLVERGADLTPGKKPQKKEE